MKKALLLLAVLLISAQLNAQWTPQTSGVVTALATISAVDNNVCWIGGNASVVLRTTDGGTTWVNKGSATTFVNADVYNIFAWDANNCLVTTSPGATFVYRTTDGGTTWAQVFTQAGGFIDAMWMTSATNGFMYGDPVGARWSLWKTTNGGATWDSTGLKLPQVGTEAGWNNALYCEGTNMWFGTNSTKVYYSTNSGTNWVAQATTGMVNSYSLWFNGVNGVSGGASNISLTANGGTLWTAAPLQGSGSVYGVTGIGSSWLIARGTNVYGSVNNGLTITTSDSVGGVVFQAIGRARTGTSVWASTSLGVIRKNSNFLVPVELTSFGANVNDGVVSLNWATATEINNAGFEIQRKSSTSDFVTVGFVNGQGSTTEKHSYSFVDNKVSSGKFVYRLKQVDFDGTSALSKQVEVEVIAPATYSLDQNYPNPFNPSTTINFSIAKAGMVKIVVYNTLGQQVKLLANEYREAGNYSVPFDASMLPSGNYLYRIDANGFTMSKKMILMK